MGYYFWHAFCPLIFRRARSVLICSNVSTTQILSHHLASHSYYSIENTLSDTVSVSPKCRHYILQNSSYRSPWPVGNIIALLFKYMAANSFSVNQEDITHFNEDMHHRLKMITLNCFLNHLSYWVIWLIPCQHRTTLYLELILVLWRLRICAFYLFILHKWVYHWDSTEQIWYLNDAWSKMNLMSERLVRERCPCS